MNDFNTVAVFSILDPLQKGYLNAETIRVYFNKFNKESVVGKEVINAILRRMSNHPDGRISFREFSLAITPEMAGLSEPAQKTEFNVQKKMEHEELMQRSP